MHTTRQQLYCRPRQTYCNCVLACAATLGQCQVSCAHNQQRAAAGAAAATAVNTKAPARPRPTHLADLVRHLCEYNESLPTSRTRICVCCVSICCRRRCCLLLACLFSFAALVLDVCCCTQQHTAVACLVGCCCLRPNKQLTTCVCVCMWGRGGNNTHSIWGAT